MRRSVDIASLLGISAFSLDKWMDQDPNFLVRTGVCVCVSGCGYGWVWVRV